MKQRFPLDLTPEERDLVLRALATFSYQRGDPASNARRNRDAAVAEDISFRLARTQHRGTVREAPQFAGGPNVS